MTAKYIEKECEIKKRRNTVTDEGFQTELFGTDTYINKMK